MDEVIFGFEISLIVLCLYFIYFAWHLRYVKFRQVAISVALALFIGAPLAGLLMYFILVVLFATCILPCQIGLAGLVYVANGILFGASLSFIVVLIISLKRYEKIQEQLYFAEHKQYRKRKNDEKAKN